MTGLYVPYDWLICAIQRWRRNLAEDGNDDVAMLGREDGDDRLDWLMCALTGLYMP